MAADRKFDVSMWLGLTDKASPQFKKFQKEIKQTSADLKSMGLAVGAAGAAMTAALGLAVKAAGDQELAINKLQTAVELSGLTWMDTKVAIDQYTASMQAMTVYGDTDMYPVLQKLLTFTNDIDAAFRASTISMDLAASGMFNLESASLYVGLALSGNVTMLGRYIGELKEANLQQEGIIDPMERTEYALSLLEAKFGGMSANQLKTFNGQVLQLLNYFGDLVEAIGDQLLPELTSMAGELTEIVKQTIAWTEEHNILVGALVGTAADIAIYATALGGILYTGGQLLILIPKLYAAIAAHPFIAVAAGVGLGTIALANYLEASQAAETSETERYLAAIKNAKTQSESLQATIDKLREKTTWDIELTAEEIKLREQIASLERQLRVEKEKEEEAARAKKLEEDKKYTNNYIALLDQAHDQAMIKEWELANNRKSWLTVAVTDITMFYDEYKEMITLFLENAIQMFTAFHQLRKLQINDEKESSLNAAFDVYNNKKNKILTTVEDEEDKNNQLAILDNDYAKQQEDINRKAIADEKKAAETMRAIAISKAYVSAGVAILKAWEYGPIFGAISSGVILATLAAQVEVIKAQRFATGTRNYGGGFAMVGEQGPELSYLPPGSDVYSNSETKKMLSGMGGRTILIQGNNFYGPGGVDDLANMLNDRNLESVQNERNF